MAIGPAPTKLLNSKFLVMDPGNWHLLPGAPDDIKKEFSEFMKSVSDDPFEWEENDE